VIAFAIVYGGLLVLAPLCALAQRRWRERTVDAVFARDRVIDWAFWLITPLFTGVLTRIATLALVAALAPVVGAGPLAQVPLAAQVVLVLLVADAVGYASHRLRHTRALWWLHRVHHAPDKLDWLAAARMHPLDDLIDNVLVGAVLLLLGTSRELFAIVGPLLLLHTLYVHMNVTWDHGPLARVLVSPAAHRWHHSREERDVNFAGMFSFIDVLGGTFHLPHDRRPHSFGASASRD
jgi:sterol desaturase/sphingolipid hydroxylase (fatty acid hydroxylase superfamily)